jgi:RCC1 and BTB domain-containing protein
MSCGRGHSLILANEGDIYAFGSNQYGQIGNGNYKNQNIPLKIQVTLKFKEISSHFSCNISIAKSINEYCFVWGKCKDKNESFPAETTIKSIHEIYAEYSNHKLTYEAIHLDNSNNGIADRISNLFNKEEFSDLKIKIEDKVIHVHKFILKISNEFFLKKFKENSRSIQESTENSLSENFIEIKGYSYDVYFAFLKYIYTDIVDIEPKKVVELLILANEYNEEGLKQRCFHIIKNGMTVENVCTLYCLSHRNNLTQLENYCFGFAFENLKDIKKTQAFDEMVKDSKNSFMIRIGEEFLKNT